MGDFSVKYKGLQDAINDWRFISRNIQTSIDELNSVISKINNNPSLSKHGYGSKVSKVKNQLISLKDDFTDKSKRIDSILQAYKNNENAVMRILQDQGIDVSAWVGDVKRQGVIAKGALWLIEQAWKTFGDDRFKCKYSMDPVNMSSGNYIYQKDFIEYQSDLPVSFGIFYNALDHTESALGFGWIHSFEIRLLVNDNGATIRNADGSVTDFVLKNNSFVPGKGQQGNLVFDGKKYLYTTSDQITYEFNEKGKWISIGSVSFSNKLIAEYENELLSHVYDQEGIEYIFTYSDTNRLMSVTDQGGRIISFSYENGNMVKATDAAGNVYSYEYDLDGYLFRIITPNGVAALSNFYDEYGRVLEQQFADGGTNRFKYDDENASLTLTQQDGSIITYIHDDEFNNVKTIYEDGEEITEYDESGNKTSVTDKNGNKYIFEYDEKGNLTAEKAPCDRTVLLEYNNDNQVKAISINNNLYGKAEYDENGHEVTYINALGHKIDKKFDEKGRLVEFVQLDGSKVEIGYDQYGNINYFNDPVTGKNTFKYDAFKRITEFKDGLGRVTSCSYDANDNLIELKNAEGNTRKYEYDANNNLIKIVEFDGTELRAEYNNINKIEKYIDQEGNETSYEYDLMWNLSRKTDPNGAETIFEYNQQNKVSSITYPDGGIEHAEYDSNGNLIKRTAQDGGVYEFQYDGLNRGVYLKDPSGVEQRFKYDLFDNISEIDYGSGIKERLEYNLLGDCVKSISRDGHVKYYSYDAMGNMTCISDDTGWLEKYEYYPGGQMKKASLADGSFREMVYDAVGNLIETRLSTGMTWHFTYDAMDRVIKAENNVGLKEFYKYDAVGNLTHVTDGFGNETSYTFNNLRKVTKITDPAGNETVYQYDVCQRVTTVLQFEGEEVNPEQINELNNDLKNYRLTYFKRDLSGRVIAMTDAAGNETKMKYDLCGRLIKKTLPEGNVIDFVYNSDGTRKSFELSDGRKAFYEYNALKELVALKDWLGTVKLERDQAGNVVKSISQDGSITGYEYDRRGNCKGITYPDGKQALYAYDLQNRLTQTRYDNELVKYHYDDFGRLTRKEYPHNYFEEYNYAGNQLLPDVKAYHQGKAVHERKYQFDAKGQIASIISGISGTRKYEYDKLGQLSSVFENDQLVESYFYDPFGNRTKSIMDGRETVYSYNNLNQMIQKTEDNHVYQYHYDRNGNLSSILEPDGFKSVFTYDSMDYLQKAQTCRGIAEYKTDGFGNRIDAVWNINGQKTTEAYTYDLTKNYDHLLSRRFGNGWNNIVRDQGLLGESGVGYYGINEIGSPTGLINASGYTSFKYDAFGRSTSNSLLPNMDQFTFGGYRTDPVTGFYHADQREYDPSSGVFTSMDPLLGSMLMPLSWNAYKYCINDPVNLVDPSGYFALTAILVAGALGAGKRLAGVGVKAAVNYVTTGKTGVTWHDVAGAAIGGIVEGEAYLFTGGTVPPGVAAGMGRFVEDMTSAGLKHATNEKGYRKEDGFHWLKTANSAMGSAIMEGIGTQVLFPHVSESIFPSWMNYRTGQAVGVLKKLAHGFIGNVTGKTWRNIGLYVTAKFTKGVLSKIGSHFLSEGAGKLLKWLGIDEKAYCQLTQGGSFDLAG